MAKLLSVRQTAKELGLDWHTTKRAIEKNQIRAVRIGSNMRVPKTEIDRLLGVTQNDGEV